MSIFALKEIDNLICKQKVYKLEIDGNCQFDEYEASIIETKRYYSQLKTMYTLIEYVQNGGGLPSTKFKDITPDKESVKEYEFKTKHLRVYAIKKRNGKIILIGGFKNNQDKDYKQFRSIKKRYLESLNVKK